MTAPPGVPRTRPLAPAANTAAPPPVLPPAPPPAAPPSAQALAEPRSGVVRNTLIAGAAVFGLFLSGLASDLLAGVISSGRYPAWIERVLNVAGVVILAVLFLVWLVGRNLEHRRSSQLSLAADLVAPGPPLRPAWFRSRVPLVGRDEEVARALRVVRARGIVAVTGAPGTGTSVVAENVVHELVRLGLADPARTAPFDLRGWSTRAPDDAPTIAGRLLATFGAAEPARAVPHVLLDAARRLRRLLTSRAVLVLDNLTVPAQVDWLVREWPRGGRRPLLVVAGQMTVSAAFPAECVVELSDLGVSDLARIWRSELTRIDRRPVTTGSAAPVDPAWLGSDDPDGWLCGVLAVCDGRAGAVRDLAREIARPGSHWSVREVVRWLARASADTMTDPRERVWLAILNRTRTSMSRKAHRLAAALAELPVAELTVEAMEAVRQGLESLSEAGTSGDVDVLDPIQELGSRYLLRQTVVGRYRMPSEVRRAVRVTEPPVERHDAVRAALPSVVQRYADLADRWLALLDSTEHAASAARWFQAEEPLLRTLLTSAYDDPDATDPDGGLLSLAIDALAHLGDVLDTWYVRQRQCTAAWLVHSNLAVLAGPAGRPDLAELAALRMAAVQRAEGDLTTASGTLAHVRSPVSRGRGTTTSALRSRHHHEQALLHLAAADCTLDDTAKAAAELAAAENELQLAWACLPRHDVHGEVTTLLTLAVVSVRQGLPDRALDRLDAAEARAQDGDDAAGQAHVAELRGTAAWMQGRAPDAAACWQRALTMFGELADTQAEARCLAHLGSAVVVAPELAGLLLEGDQRPVDEVSAIHHAQAWLERSRRLRAGQPPHPLANYYLSLARSRSARTTPPPDGRGRAGSGPAGSGPAGSGPAGSGPAGPDDAEPPRVPAELGRDDPGRRAPGAGGEIDHVGTDASASRDGSDDPDDDPTADPDAEDDEVLADEMALPARSRPQHLARGAESLVRRLVTGLGRRFGS